MEDEQVEFAAQLLKKVIFFKRMVRSIMGN